MKKHLIRGATKHSIRDVSARFLTTIRGKDVRRVKVGFSFTLLLVRYMVLNWERGKLTDDEKEDLILFSGLWDLI